MKRIDDADALVLAMAALAALPWVTSVDAMYVLLGQLVLIVAHEDLREAARCRRTS